MAPINDLSNGLKNFSHDISKGWEDFSKTFGSNFQTAVHNLLKEEKSTTQEASRKLNSKSTRNSINSNSSNGTKARKKKSPGKQVSPENNKEGPNLPSIRTKPTAEEEDMELIHSLEESTIPSSFSTYTGDWIPEAEEVQRLRPPLPSPSASHVKSAWTKPTLEKATIPIPKAQPPSSEPISYAQFKTNGPINREDLGRATWAFLHTLAAQYPEKPTKQQQRDVKEFMNILTRIYPCRICSEHFKEVIKNNPPEVGSRAELSYYMCRIHNIVNRSLNKPQFPCQRIENRWGTLDCEDDACSMEPHLIKKK